MEPKEIVENGLQARKEIRKAEARANAYRSAASAQKDARMAEMMNHKKDTVRWEEEKARLEKLILSQHGEIRKLQRERSARNKQDRKTMRLVILAGFVNCLVAFMILFSTLGLLPDPWSSNSLTISAAVCMFHVGVVLAMKKR